MPDVVQATPEIVAPSELLREIEWKNGSCPCCGALWRDGSHAEGCRLEAAIEVVHCYPGAELIATERQRRVEVEGFDADRDDRYTDRSLIEAALGYLSAVLLPEWITTGPPPIWPWPRAWWKPGSAIRMLTKSGALIAAEIDRRLRAGECP